MRLAERPSLIDVLDELERDGLVERIVVSEQAAVRYAVTPAGAAAHMRRSSDNEDN